MRLRSRRSVLAAIGLSLPAAAALALTRPWREDAEALSPGEALLRRFPDPTPGPPAGYDTRPRNVRGGVVTAVSDTELHVHNSDGDLVFRLQPDTVRDEGLWTGHLPIEVGDKVLARGEPGANGSFRVDELWVNSKMWLGPILEVLAPDGDEVARIRLRDRYDLSPYHQQEPEGHIVAIHPQTIVSGPFQPTNANVIGYTVPQGPASERDFSLAPGQHFEATGREYHGVLFAVGATI